MKNPWYKWDDSRFQLKKCDFCPKKSNQSHRADAFDFFAQACSEHAYRLEGAYQIAVKQCEVQDVIES